MRDDQPLEPLTERRIELLYKPRRPGTNARPTPDHPSRIPRAGAPDAIVAPLRSVAAGTVSVTLSSSLNSSPVFVTTVRSGCVSWLRLAVSGRR